MFHVKHIQYVSVVYNLIKYKSLIFINLLKLNNRNVSCETYCICFSSVHSYLL